MPGSQHMHPDYNSYYVQPQFSADQAQYPDGFVDPSAYYYQHGTTPAQPSPLTPISRSAGGNDAGPGRIKWSRIALLILGVAIAGFAVINLTHSTQGAARDASKATASTSGAGMAPVPATTAMAIKPPPPAAYSRSTAHATSAASRARHNRRHTAGSGGRAVPVSGTSGMGSMPGMPMPRGSHMRAASGGGHNAMRGRRGAAGARSLPYTGASTWIAALLGVLMLGAGVFVQYKALAIGDTAAMYRRGPLLRPFWLIALTIRNIPNAAAFVARRMPEIARASMRVRAALDARGVESDYTSARRS